MLSLTSRLLIAASLVLAGFMGLSGFALDRAFSSSAEAAAKDRLKGHLYALLAAADLNLDQQLQVPATLPEERFTRPSSGLYGLISDKQGELLWRSVSALGRELPHFSNLAAGEYRFGRVSTRDNQTLFNYSFAVSWESDRGAQQYIFSVQEDLDAYHAQVQGFRQSIWLWLGIVSGVLLVLQVVILHWGLAPLRKVANDVREIDAGRQIQLDGHYPRELRGLTNNLNALLRSQQAQQERYRNSLGDLAHSLKTPLAVLGGIVDAGKVSAAHEVSAAEQLERMREIVEYQLQRAATAGRGTLGAAVRVHELLEKLRRSLDKVYVEKAPSVELVCAANVVFHGDQGDLMECLGNLLDNAYKWSQTTVVVTARPVAAAATQKPGLWLQIEDDGPGFPAELAEQLLQRGMRADVSVEGHGIGLAMVRNIVTAYSGSLKIGRAPIGGAKLTVNFPPI